ncbi:hypothetical protein GYMLUDRAFT_1005708 [Collybiopsis luxurians FD-317 M1]|uniref:Uncharacterized protein n=1 Tax=Collybiopsis luxurians FD-317 M1 TaxID=944289 RepID=A0A0D0C8K3_9AGAR|nr:hypothetical protein GYMLUDRAFT_1005708 [Collybiopsis luxurians FD-317 M1]
MSKSDFSNSNLIIRGDPSVLPYTSAMAPFTKRKTSDTTYFKSTLHEPKELVSSLPSSPMQALMDKQNEDFPSIDMDRKPTASLSLCPIIPPTPASQAVASGSQLPFIVKNKRNAEGSNGSKTKALKAAEVEKKNEHAYDYIDAMTAEDDFNLKSMADLYYSLTGYGPSR